MLSHLSSCSFKHCQGRTEHSRGLFLTPWTAALQASLSITNSQSLFKLISIELVMLPNYLILCHPLLLLPSIFPSIRIFSSESVLRIRWPKYWSFSSNSILSMAVQELVAVLEFSQEKMSTHPSTPPSCKNRYSFTYTLKSYHPIRITTGIFFLLYKVLISLAADNRDPC